jgi:hypothetical protein|eukprot:COSAG01_NODE_7942_length_2981_cov_27.772033_3_plen_57_part_00
MVVCYSGYEGSALNTAGLYTCLRALVKLCSAARPVQCDWRACLIRVLDALEMCIGH